MILESVEAEHFRNLGGKMVCGRGLNIVLGNNGHGKTNWLEAISLLATAKSFKTSRLQESINFNEEMAVVCGQVRKSKAITRTLRIILRGNTKTLTVNDKKATAAEFIGQLHTINFNSSELSIIRGGPDSRRKFLDDGIISIYPPFVQTLSEYNRVIKQKNALLQSAEEGKFSLEKITELLEPWNERLVRLATHIHKARLRFTERLNEVLEKKFFDREEVAIRYASSLEGKGDLSDYSELLTKRLKIRTQAEIISRHSLIGAHRDDLEIHFDGRDLRKYGSSGQQRSALLILQLAILSVYYSQYEEYPLFLLDDVEAELDYRRIERLLEFLKDKTQTFMTTSKKSFVDKFVKEAKLHRVSEGHIG